MKLAVYSLHIEFSEPVLGTAPLDKEIFTNFIATKKGGPGDTHNAPLTEATLEEELDTLNEDKGKTGFHRLPGTDEPMIYDYWLKGFAKDACGMLRYDTGSLSKNLKAYKKIIDGTLFIAPRRIKLNLTGPLEILERPLRAQTMQGERVALAYSEMAPVGTWFDCELKVMGDQITQPLLVEWLDYGQLRGLGQWRNSSWGRFSYTLAQSAAKA